MDCFKKVLATGFAATFCGAAMAAPVAISNHSFENPDVGGAGGWSDANVDWGDDAGASPEEFTEHIAGFSADGVNHTGVNTGSLITQDVAATYTSGMQYTLTVAIGNRGSQGTLDEDDAEIRLVDASNGNILASSIFNTGALTADDTFTDVSIVYNAGAGVDGNGIRIELAAIGATAGSRAHYDNVRLDEAIPEPGSLALLGLGGLTLLRRRRK
ncbi:PEP-CTERM sorting domain-containing protein [Phycisphaeraceae bacterium D3-23]